MRRGPINTCHRGREKVFLLILYEKVEEHECSKFRESPMFVEPHLLILLSLLDHRPSKPAQLHLSAAVCLH